MSHLAKMSAVDHKAASHMPAEAENCRPVPSAIREAVGIFHRSESLQGTIDELFSSSFHRSELSLLVSESALQGKLGRRYEKISVLVGDPAVRGQPTSQQRRSATPWAR